MIKNRLLALLAGNAKKGEFKAEGNVIYVYDVIVASDADAAWWGGVSAESFVKALRGMSGDVQLRINSPGGDVFGAKAMAQAVREYPGKVTAHVDGYAASAASYLATSAESTIMAPGSMMMIHKAWTIALGNADEFRATAGLLEKIDGTIAADYAASAERRGKNAQDFEALMAAETWFTPAEAIEAGLADEEAGDRIQAKVEWDLVGLRPCASTEVGAVRRAGASGGDRAAGCGRNQRDRAAAPGPCVRPAAPTSCLSASRARADRRAAIWRPFS
jgi:ATP-dependent Clp protease protease subunit